MEKVVKSHREKCQIVLYEFVKFNIDKDDTITPEQMQNAFDKISKQTYDRDILEEIFQNAQQLCQRQQITLGDWVESWIQAEQRLLQKIEQKNESIRSWQHEQSTLVTNLEEQQEKESLNYDGVMKDSTLNLEILEVKGVDWLSNQALYIHILCGGYNLYSKQSNNMKWEESFQIPIQTGQEELMMTLQGLNGDKKDVFVGQSIVQMYKLKDQKYHQNYFQLFEENGNAGTGLIALKLRWVHSQVKLYTELLQEYQNQLDAVFMDLHSYEDMLTTMYQPFKFIFDKDEDIIQRLQEYKMHQKYLDKLHQEQSNRLTELDEKQRNYRLEKEGIDDQLRNIQDRDKQLPFSYSQQGFLIGCLTIALLTSLFRTFFLDTLVVGVFTGVYSVGLINSKYMLVLCGSSVQACIFDMIWFKMVGQQLWKTNSLLVSGQLEQQRFTVVMSIIYFVLRIIIFMLIIYNYFQLSEIESEIEARNIKKQKLEKKQIKREMDIKRMDQSKNDIEMYYSKK